MISQGPDVNAKALKKIAEYTVTYGPLLVAVSNVNTNAKRELIKKEEERTSPSDFEEQSTP